MTDLRYAIVCGHVFRRELPILRFVRDEPMDDADSGWQAVCGVANHADESPPDAELVHLSHVLETEPSLREWIEAPWHVEVVREAVGAAWRVVQAPSNDAHA